MGKGKRTIRHHKTQQCPECGGIGIRQIFDWGSGKTFYPTCQTCNGSGIVAKDKDREK